MTIIAHGRSCPSICQIKANQEGGLAGLCSRMVARLDFKARASGAVDARGITAKQDELVASILAFRSENKHGIM